MECIANTLQSQIDEAAMQVKKSHPKWPLITKPVVLKSGVYHIKKPVRLRSGVCLRGEHQSSTIIVSHLQGDDAVFESDPEEELYATQVSSLHAISERKHEGTFLRLHNANRNCKFSDMFIENFGYSIFGIECYTTVFQDLGIYLCMEGPHFINLTNGRLYNIKTENCAGNGLYLGPSKTKTDSASGTDIRGYVAQGNGQCGVLLDRVDQVHFTSLFLEGNNRARMRASGDNGDYAQVRLIADRLNKNKRNGNILFKSTFITPGRSDLSVDRGIAVDIQLAELVSFEGGLIRNWKDSFSRAFSVSSDVNVFRVENMTFDGWNSNEIFEVDAERVLLFDNLLTMQEQSYYRLPNRDTEVKS